MDKVSETRIVATVVNVQQCFQQRIDGGDVSGLEWFQAQPKWGISVNNTARAEQ